MADVADGLAFLGEVFSKPLQRLDSVSGDSLHSEETNPDVGRASMESISADIALLRTELSKEDSICLDHLSNISSIEIPSHFISPTKQRMAESEAAEAEKEPSHERSQMQTLSPPSPVHRFPDADSNGLHDSSIETSVIRTLSSHAPRTPTSASSRDVTPGARSTSVFTPTSMMAGALTDISVDSVPSEDFYHLRYMLAQVEADKVALEDSLKEAEMKRQEMASRLRSVEGNGERLKALLKNAEQQLQQSKTERDDAFGMRFYLERRVQELEKLVNEQAKSLSPMSDANRQAEDIARLRLDVQHWQSMAQQKEAESQRLREENAGVTVQLAECKLRYAETKAHCEDVEGQLTVHQASLAAMAVELRDRREEIRSLLLVAPMPRNSGSKKVPPPR